MKSPCYSSHVKKHDMLQLIGRIVFFIRGKSDGRHFIGCWVLRPACEPNLFHTFSVGKSQYVYNIYLYIRTRMLKLFLFCILFANSCLYTEAYSGHTYICLFFLLNLSTTTMVVVIIC